jgi:hypothetical protein
MAAQRVRVVVTRSAVNVGAQAEVRVNPLVTGGLTQAQTDALYEPLGAVSDHEGEANPHPVYLTAAEGSAAYEALGAVAAHVALGDPHVQYLTEAAAAIAYEAAGTAAAAVATHVGLADPHTQYLTEAAAATTYQTVPSEITVTPSSQQDDYSPTGWAAATEVRLVPTACVVITGFAALAAGNVKTLRNTSTYLVVLAVGPTDSSAANRIISGLRAGSHVLLYPGDVVRLVYDGTAAVWVATHVRYLYACGHGVIRLAVPTISNIPEGELNIDAASGTRTTPVPSTASFLASRYRCSFATVAGASNISRARMSNFMFPPGNGSGRGGWAWTSAWGRETSPDDLSTSFVGLYPGDSPGGTYSLMTDCAGFVVEAADTSWYFQHNDGSGSATKVPLGAGYPRNTTAWVRGHMHWDPYESAKLHYAAWREDDPTVLPVVGTATTNLPSSNGAPWMGTCNLTSTLSHALAFETITMWSPS